MVSYFQTQLSSELLLVLLAYCKGKVHLKELLLFVYLGVCAALVGCSTCGVEGVLSS